MKRRRESDPGPPVAARALAHAVSSRVSTGCRCTSGACARSTCRGSGLARQVAEPAQREEHAVLEHGEEAAHLVGVVVERAVFGLVVEREVELDAEIALVPGRLDELARAASR